MASGAGALAGESGRPGNLRRRTRQVVLQLRPRQRSLALGRMGDAPEVGAVGCNSGSDQ